MARWLIALAVLAVVLLVTWQTGWLADLGLVSRGAPGTEAEATLEARAAHDAALAERASLAGREGAKPAAVVVAPPITGPRVTGRVVDPAGRGVAGARVLSLPDTNGKVARFEEYGQAGNPGSTATTDAEGRFVVAVSKEAPFHLVAASAPEFALGIKADLAPGSDVVLVLEPARVQTGVVKDRDGNGIV